MKYWNRQILKGRSTYETSRSSPKSAAVARKKHCSIRTEQAYVAWIKRFILFHGKRHSKDMGDKEIAQYISRLATEEKVAASTQTQALNAFVHNDLCTGAPLVSLSRWHPLCPQKIKVRWDFWVFSILSADSVESHPPQIFELVSIRNEDRNEYFLLPNTPLISVPGWNLLLFLLFFFLLRWLSLFFLLLSLYLFFSFLLWLFYLLFLLFFFLFFFSL